MNKLILIFVVQAIASFAFAGIQIPAIGDSGEYINAGCAPNVVEDNVQRTDRIVAQTAASSEFASAKRFRQAAAAIAAEKAPAVRMTKYLALVGIDARDTHAVAEFAGQRDVSVKEVSLLMTNTGLTGPQAKKLVGSLVDGLRGDLN